MDVRAVLAGRSDLQGAEVILLDTHAILWLLGGHRRVDGVIASGRSLLVSPVSLLEIRFLIEAGKVRIAERDWEEGLSRDRRFRIEHAQHIAPQDIPRFAQLKVIPSMQPYHCIDDGRYAEKYLGRERCKTTYAFKSLFDTGATVAFGSDWFVAPPAPLEGIYAAVTRRTLDDKNPNGWFPEQKITVEQALKAYTVNAAYASFEEKDKGSLEVGKLGDFVLLGTDIRTLAPEKIKDVKVVMTVVGGKIVFKND